MDKTAAVPPEVEAYCDAVAAEGARLMEAARQGPTAPVPTCPDWDVTELVRHMATVHRWVDGVLAAASPAPAPWPTEVPEQWADVAAFYDDGLGRLVAALRAADPERPVWNWWAGGPAPLRAWHRRMAHETAVHRADAEIAVAGVPSPLAPAMAADGIDEYLMLADRRLAHRPLDRLDGRLGLVADDADLALTVSLAPDGLEVGTGLGGADVVVSGPASSVFFWLVQRLTLGTLGVEGDDEVARDWQRVTF
jgi:uncharacterized protein (TIGR03083 family)